MDQYTIKVSGLREYAMRAEKPCYWRRRGTTEWQTYTEAEAADTESSADENPALPLYLSVVRQQQPPPTEFHWCLFVAREGSPGTVYQVEGDHLYMTYRQKMDEHITISDDFHDIYQLATLDDAGAAAVEHIARTEPPPQAATQGEVRDTCQSWTIRVVQRLIAQGIVDQKWYSLLWDLTTSPTLLARRQEIVSSATSLSVMEDRTLDILHS